MLRVAIRPSYKHKERHDTKYINFIQIYYTPPEGVYNQQKYF